MYNLSKACGDAKKERMAVRPGVDGGGRRIFDECEFEQSVVSSSTASDIPPSKAANSVETSAEQPETKGSSPLERYIEKTKTEPRDPSSTGTTSVSEAASSKQTRKMSNLSRKKEISPTSALRQRRLGLRAQREFSKNRLEDVDEIETPPSTPIGPRSTISPGLDAEPPPARCGSSSSASLDGVAGNANETDNENHGENEIHDARHGQVEFLAHRLESIEEVVSVQDLEVDHQKELEFDHQKELLDDAVEAADVQAERPKSERPTWLMPAAVTLIVLMTVGVVLGVVLGKNGGDDGSEMSSSMSDMPSALPSAAPSEVPTTASYAEVSQLLLQLWPAVNSLDDSTSPQARAVEWISTQDELRTLGRPDRFLQRFAVVTFYYALGGPDWIDQANFLSPSSHECDWFSAAPDEIGSYTGRLGIAKCSVFLQPTRIELVQNNLAGTLPEEIAILTNLKYMLLNANGITGTIPLSVWRSPVLQLLHAPFNDLSGSIPTEVGKAEELLEIWFQESSMTGRIPSELGRLTKLRRVSLVAAGQHTGSMPNTLQQLTDMVLFDVSYNDLTGTLPSWFPSGWPSLVDFSVAFNRFSGTIPNDNLGTLPLIRASLWNNSFGGPFPSSFASVPNLTMLDMSYNQLTGSLPTQWSTPHLQMLSVSGNNLAGSLPNLLSTVLFDLDVQENLFTGTIPELYGNTMTDLVAGLFGDNLLTGSVPSSFGQIQSLEALAVNNNIMTGDLSFFCDGQSFVLPDMEILASDCLDEVSCPCCTYCCDENDECINYDLNQQ